MTYTIRQITKENPQAAFVSDVALAWYPAHSNNTRLAGSYSWTRQKIGEELPSLDALNTLRFGFESDEIAKLGNRHLWEAIYGHGKSHLALALANFFGKPAGSPEVNAVLEAIKHAKGDYIGLKNFKEERQPYLVLTLFGNDTITIAQGVVRGLEKAFKANPITRDEDLGLWFKPAEEGLEALSAKQADVEKATAFLQTLTPPLTLQDLRDDLISRRGQYREQLSQMVHHVTGFPPAFGDMLGPKQVIESVVERYCGEGKPFAGLLILFDEFGRFIQDYANEYDLLSKNQPLQNLLEAVAGLQSRAAIVAFTQAKPEGIAKRAMGAGSARLDEVNRELTRFPDPQRKVLVSPLEAVLGDFLQQEQEHLSAILDSNPSAEAELDAAVDMTKLLFRARYASWTPQQVQKQLGYECYPLHPLTTALLCTLGIRETVSARPSLGFVQEAYRRFADYPALTTNGTLQFIPATQLVAYFKESLAKNDEDWNRYQNALRLAGAALPQLKMPESTHLKDDVLAAMFVRETANLAIGTGLTDHEGIISALCGHSRTEVEQALRELAADGRIQYDPAGKKYLFWSLGQDGMKASRTLALETDQLVLDSVDFANALLKQLHTLNYSEEVALGNAIDWAAPVYIIPCVLWSRAYLRQLIRRYQLNTEGTWLDTSVRRGYVIRPVGNIDEEVAWLRTHAQADFDAVIQDLDPAYPPPAVLVLPQQPHNGLLRALAQQQVLDGWGAQTRADLGEKAIEQIQAQTAEQRKLEIEKLRSEERRIIDYKVPSVYAPTVNAIFSTNPTPSLSAILKACYGPAYGWRAPYLDDLSTGTNYRRGVWTACDFLRRDKFNDWDENTRSSAGAPARKVYDKVLRDTPNTWGVVDAGLRVVDPRLDVVQRGWQVLEGAVPVGTNPDERVSLRAPLLKLLNAPYGYDYYALGLLFCAWAGRHRRTLHFYHGVTRQRLSGEEWFTTETNFERVISTLLGPLDLHAAREDQGAVKVHIEQILREWQDHKNLEYSEAETRLAELQDYANNEGSDPELREQTIETVSQLTAAIQNIRDYHSQLNRITEELPALTNAHPDTIQTLVKHLTYVRSGPPQVSVQSFNSGHSGQVEAQLLNKLRTLTIQICNIYTSPLQINTLNKCKESEIKLFSTKSYLNSLTDEIGIFRVEEAMLTIQKERDRLKGEELDSDFLARLKEVEKLKNLGELRAALEEITSRNVHSEKGSAAKQSTLETIQCRIKELEENLTSYYIKASDLPEREGKSIKVLAKEISTLTSTLQRQHDNYLNTEPEATKYSQALKWCEIWGKIMDDITDLSDDTPENNSELQKLLKKYEKLRLIEGSTENQKSFVLEARQAVEDKFKEHVQVAIDTLNDLITRNEQKDESEPPAKIYKELQTAMDSAFHFLPKEEIKRRERLEKALQKRLDADQVEDIAFRFSQIKDVEQRKSCVARLRQLLEQETYVTAD
ncbi:hypothetical protein [Adhaeribacter rhizoryzae]|uniref:Uncharacterized protein n=1 Tax=Adhaeribacter rhizoryzae TaxID=2607907 RepID=A0A5M6DPL5_9BACT|nr:hypothetical protein [Adhaeribacter rhizoryzae]KAA5548346.1 hypothetical protein F0145_06370 [Adhaeribacter rhizoryzae]